METTSLNGSYLMEKKFEFMLDSVNKKVANELNALKNVISSMDSELTEIKKQLNGMQRAAPAAVFENSSNLNNNRRDAPARAQDNGAVKPRFGDYEPEDVPIEKFFYFGNRK